LVCTDKVLMYNGKYSRTKCEYNLIESDRQRTPIKHQNGSGNNKMGNKPVIIRSNVQACNGIIHVVDSLLLPFTPTLIGDDDMGGDPGFGVDPTCDPSPDCVPRYGNGVQLHFCCLTDDQWEPGLIGNDDLGGDPGFGIDPNQCDPSPDCEPYWGNGQQLHFCCDDDDDGIGNDDAGGDPGFGIGTIEECCVNKGGAYRPSQNADGSVSQWCDYEGTLYEGIYFWSVQCEGINDDDCIKEAYGEGGSNNEDKCLECCIVHYQKRFTQCDIDYGNTDPNVPDTEFGDALQRCDQYNIRAYIMCGSKCVEGCDDSCNTDYKQCMRLCTTIYGKEGDECRLECIQDVSTCHDECHGVAMDYFDDKSPF